MPRSSWSLATVLAVPVLLLALAGPSAAQTVYVGAPPTVTYYAAPTVTYYTPPVVVNYAPAPVVTYYSPVVAAPVPAAVTTYRYGLFGRRVVVTNYGYAPAAPAVSYYAAPAPVVSYYSAPVVVPRRTVVRYYYR